jgi:hypothetical protein
MQREETYTKTHTKMNNPIKSIIVPAFASTVQSGGNVINSPFVRKVVGYAQDKGKLAALKAEIKAELEAILGTVPAKQQKGAIKELRAALVAGGISKQDVSVILLDLGIRERAAAKKGEDLAEELADAIEALKALATEAAGEKAVIALRRAYLSLQAKKD